MTFSWSAAWFTHISLDTGLQKGEGKSILSYTTALPIFKKMCVFSRKSSIYIKVTVSIVRYNLKALIKTITI